MVLRPPTVTVPESGSIILLTTRIVVVLPQPDGPMYTELALGNRQRQVIDGGMHRARKLLGERGDLDHGARIPAGVSAICSQPNRRSAPIDSSVAGIAPTSSCGSAIIAIPAVMIPPSPPPPI